MGKWGLLAPNLNDISSHNSQVLGFAITHIQILDTNVATNMESHPLTKVYRILESDKRELAPKYKTVNGYFIYLPLVSTANCRFCVHEESKVNIEIRTWDEVIANAYRVRYLEADRIRNCLESEIWPSMIVASVELEGRFGEYLDNPKATERS